MFEVLIRGAKIIDGSGAPAFSGDVGIQNGKITVLKPGEEVTAETVIEAKGMCVCPGFIDAHSHGDGNIGKDYTNWSKTTQGITTQIAGQCGSTNFPSSADPELFRQHAELVPTVGALGHAVTASFSSFRNYMEQQKISTHYMQFAGHKALRLTAMGIAGRKSTAKELDIMKGLLRESMEAGCIGLTSGLTYPPSGFADAHEITELLKVIEPFGGIYASHIRNESDRVVESVQEMLDCARDAGVHAHISHHKACGVNNWGKSKDTLAMVDERIAAGQVVTMDIYPYTACMTSLSVCLPLSEFSYGLDERIARLQNKALRKEIAAEMRAHCLQYSQLTDFSDVMVCNCARTPQYNAITIDRIAAERGADPFDTFFDLLIENRFSISAVFFCMDEADLCRIFQHKQTMIGTDGLVYSMTGETHPRGIATFPKAINYFVREKKLATLEETIYKMTGLTAKWFRMENKGLIRDGYDADLLIINPDTIAEQNTYQDSLKPCTGISHVFVDGQLVCKDGIMTGVHPGRIILRK